MLYGSEKEAQDFGGIILNLCQESFFFSHKIIWFINSIDFSNISEPNLDLDVLIQQIKEVTNNSCSLYVGNSQKLTKFMNKSLKTFTEEDNKKNLEIIKEYNQGRYKSDIDYEAISLQPFTRNQLFDPFYSTILFFDALSEIAFGLLKSHNRLLYLQESLNQLNNLLPASVYLPLNVNNARNCSVLHIPISEATVFSTKERAPFKISVELWYPYKEYKSAYSKIIRKSIAVNSDNSSSFTEIAEVHRDIPELCGNKHPLKPVEEELHYKPLSVYSDGVSVVYAGELENNSNHERQTFLMREERVRLNSPYGGLETWRLVNIIVKCGDDLRQEELAIQLITYFNRIFKEKKLDIWLYPYEIIATHKNCGIIECVSDAISIDGLKKSLPSDKNTLYDYFLNTMGEDGSQSFKDAQYEFMKSLVGYSLVCYILKIKDRHNGNILIDSSGHIIHIDFGFMLSNSPGGNLNFETAPFKLTDDFEKLLNLRRSVLFMKFRSLCVKGYKALMEKTEQIVLMVEMMRTGTGAGLPCFTGGDAIDELKKRLMPQEVMGKAACKYYINSLIDDSLECWTTRCYDRFQYCCQGIFY